MYWSITKQLKTKNTPNKQTKKNPTVKPKAKP